MNELQGHIAQSLKDAGASDNVASIASQLITQGAATAAGATVGAVAGNTTAGAAVGLNIDANNRMLHKEETNKLGQLQKGKTQEEQQRLADAACAMTKCSAGIPDSDPNNTNQQQRQHPRRYQRQRPHQRG